MQEKLLEKNYISPDLSSVVRLRRDIELYGHCLDTTKAQIIDEEKTQAAEVLSTRNFYADIPRRYNIAGNDLIDNHGVSLKSVLDNGIDYLLDNSSHKIGFEWELRRREIERRNLDNIISSPDGIACVEISSTDLTRPKAELLEQGYTGDTLVRISYKQPGNVYQKNIVVKTSDLETLNMLRKRIDKGSHTLDSSEKLLNEMMYVSIEPDKFDSFCADIKNFITYESQKNFPARFIAGIVRKFKDGNREAWSVVENNPDIFNELISRFEQIAKNPNFSAIDINTIRAGCWQALIDGAKRKNLDHYPTINDGISKAKAIGAVFTSCGGTVGLSVPSQYSASLLFDRYSVAKNLLNRIDSLGACRSCGARGLLYGCGVYCHYCNRIWCNVYMSTGKQLSDKEIRQSKYLIYFRF